MAARTVSARILPVAQAQLADIASHGGERIVLQEGGETVAVLVCPSDLKALEALEDRLDLLDALEALADLRASGGTDFEQLKAERGL